MRRALIGRQSCAGKSNSGEQMLAGGECVVRVANSGEAAVVGGDNLCGCSPPAEGLCPELGVSSDEKGDIRHRKLPAVT